MTSSAGPSWISGPVPGRAPVPPGIPCPFSRQVVNHSLDPFGTDGLWWNYTAPARPLENLPVTFHGITGALALNGPPETPRSSACRAQELRVCDARRPFPGHVTAVVSTVMIGRHTGDAILYFTSKEQAPWAAAGQSGNGST